MWKTKCPLIIGASCPEEKALLHEERLKDCTSSLGEGKESGFSPVAGAVLVLGQTVKLQPGATQWQMKSCFHEKKEILGQFF